MIKLRHVKVCILSGAVTAKYYYFSLYFPTFIFLLTMSLQMTKIQKKQDCQGLLSLAPFDAIPFHLEYYIQREGQHDNVSFY